MTGNSGHRGRPTTAAAAALPVVRPHYRFSCAIGAGAARRPDSSPEEERGLLAAAAGNDQRRDSTERRGGGLWPHLKHMSLLILLLCGQWLRRLVVGVVVVFSFLSLPKKAIIVDTPTHSLFQFRRSVKIFIVLSRVEMLKHFSILIIFTVGGQSIRDSRRRHVI